MGGVGGGYRELVVWQKGMELVVAIYEMTSSFPDAEQFGLTSQLRRASVSIPSNIAEGHARGSGDYRRHIMIARGSLAELETQLELTVRLNYTNREEAIPLWQLMQEVGRMLTKLSQVVCWALGIRY